MVSVPKWQCCRFPNNCISDGTTVFGSVPKCTCCHFLNNCISDDTTVFSSVPKCRYYHFLNNCISDDITVFSSVPKWKCCHCVNICISEVTTFFTLFPYGDVTWRIYLLFICTLQYIDDIHMHTENILSVMMSAQNNCEAHYTRIDIKWWIYTFLHIADFTPLEMM